MNLSTSNYGDNRWTLDHCDIRFSSICQTSACVAGQFRCTDGNGCISKSWICDGVYQCTDRSDEQLCSGNTIERPLVPSSMGFSHFNCHVARGIGTEGMVNIDVRYWKHKNIW